MSLPVVLKVKKLDPRAEIPRHAHEDDACFDLKILIDESANMPKYSEVMVGNGQKAVSLIEGGRTCPIAPGESVVFHTGLAFETEPGYNMKVHVRSSIGIKKNLILSNATAVIDTATYRGEARVALTNIGNYTVFVSDGDRVAQAEIVRTLPVCIAEVDELTETERGTGGIGSTGV